ncbi:MAG: ABC transporter ATP-binding protein [Planctomyces sp.]|nr:ABC transporter ATP-binding protein [Planctomyces sp.]MBA4038989.1 ABC transporter ATP-binding protein [Planctomyces sp.]MBA4120244.1 ABC transporter ATP-binding protein [Isosphaera sp.]
MSGLRPSSRQRYQSYLQARRGRNTAAAAGDSPAPARADAPARDWTNEPPEEGLRRAGRPLGTLLRAFLAETRGRRSAVAVALLTLTVATLLGLLNPLFTKFTFDYVLLDTPGPGAIPRWLGLPRDRAALLWLVGGAMVGLALLNTALGTLGRWHLTRAQRAVQAGVRRRVFERLSRMPIHRIHAIKSGGISGILREDAGNAGDMLFSAVYNPLRAIITFLGGLGALALIDWWMLLGGLLLVPVVYLSHRTWVARIRPIHRAIKATRTATDAHATEVFAGLRVVRAFARAPAEKARYARGVHFQLRQEMLAWWWVRSVETLWMVLVPLASAGALVFGGMQVVAGNLTVGDVAAFVAYLLMLLGPLDVLVSTSTQLQHALAGWDRCLDVLAEPEEFAGVSPAGLHRPARATTPGRVTLEGVWYTYAGRAEPALRQIDLDALPGQTVALVGRSGSGKSTLCNLVARFDDPTSGRVLLDGRDLRAVEPAAYRSLLGIVEQDVFLFDGTIAENIAYADPSASPERVARAAGAAHADEFIGQMPAGYQTLIGERGVRLSGGQRQRLAIARAILADPRVLILDEATSNLDTQSERLIQAGLERLMRGRTSFVIAHRLSTIRHADLIVVLEHGRIIEQGTHAQLLAAEGRYWDMLTAQLGAARDYAASGPGPALHPGPGPQPGARRG